jgi:murein L,D-transpeptidase YafK
VNVRSFQLAVFILLVLPLSATAADSVADSAALGAEIEQVDRVVVIKSQRRLYLMRDGRALREMDIALGLAPAGHKTKSGDSRTPEGVYMLDTRNPGSDFFLSMHVSYPNAADTARAASLGVDPGGQIMIHGLPNDMRYDESHYQGWDWTDGCIAVSNADMIDIWLMTPDKTPIEIRP